MDKEPYSMKKLQGKPEIRLAIGWLKHKYQVGESGSISKMGVYQDYLRMCATNAVEPTTCSVFGKVVRMAFPRILCARKGPRGSSKHHYKNLRRKIDDEQELLSLEGVVIEPDPSPDSPDSTVNSYSSAKDPPDVTARDASTSLPSFLNYLDVPHNQQPPPRNSRTVSFHTFDPARSYSLQDEGDDDDDGDRHDDDVMAVDSQTAMNPTADTADRTTPTHTLSITPAHTREEKAPGKPRRRGRPPKGGSNKKKTKKTKRQKTTTTAPGQLYPPAVVLQHHLHQSHQLMHFSTLTNTTTTTTAATRSLPPPILPLQRSPPPTTTTTLHHHSPPKFVPILPAHTALLPTPATTAAPPPHSGLRPILPAPAPVPQPFSFFPTPTTPTHATATTIPAPSTFGRPTEGYSAPHAERGGDSGVPLSSGLEGKEDKDAMASLGYHPHQTSIEFSAFPFPVPSSIFELVLPGLSAEYDLGAHATAFSSLNQNYYHNLFENVICWELGALKDTIDRFWHDARHMAGLLSLEPVVHQVAAIDERCYYQLAELLLTNPLELSVSQFEACLAQFLHFFPAWHDLAVEQTMMQGSRLEAEKRRKMEEFTQLLGRYCSVLPLEDGQASTKTSPPAPSPFPLLLPCIAAAGREEEQQHQQQQQQLQQLQEQYRRYLTADTTCQPPAPSLMIHGITSMLPPGGVTTPPRSPLLPHMSSFPST